jgi:hypothetical protein
MIVELAGSDEHSRALESIVSLFIPALSALLGVWLSNWWTNKQAKARFEFERQEAIRREAAAQRETSRVELFKRDLAALEAFVRAAVGMSVAARSVINASTADESDWKLALGNVGPEQEAEAVYACYFQDQLVTWTGFVGKYASFQRLVLTMRLAFLVLKLPAASTLEKAQFETAKKEAMEAYRVLLETQQKLMEDVNKLASRIRSKSDAT